MLAKTTNRCKLQCFQIICLLVLCPDLHLHSGEVTAHILSFLYSGGFLHTIYVTSQLITSSSTVTGESALYILHTSQVLNLISIFIAWVVYPKSPSKSETNNSGATNIESYVTTEAKMCGALHLCQLCLHRGVLQTKHTEMTDATECSSPILCGGGGASAHTYYK